MAPDCQWPIPSSGWDWEVPAGPSSLDGGVEGVARAGKVRLGSQYPLPEPPFPLCLATSCSPAAGTLLLEDTFPAPPLGPAPHYYSHAALCCLCTHASKPLQSAISFLCQAEFHGVPGLHPRLTIQDLAQGSLQ